MVALGMATIVFSFMTLSGVGIPAAVLLMIATAVVTVAVAYFKPDDVERWLDKVIHFGVNGSGAFDNIEMQEAALISLGRT